MTTNANPPAGAEKPAEKPAAAVATKALTPIAHFRLELHKLRPQLQMALPRHVPIDRFVRILLTTVRQKPDLLDCVPETVFACIMQCAQLGLSTDQLRQEAHLVPFKNGQRNNRLECQLIVGYQGLIKLTRNTGEIKTVSARAVYAKDKFRYEYGLNERLKHIPSDEEDPGPLVAAYVIFFFKDGGKQFDVMRRKEIERIRGRSKGYQSNASRSPWTTDFDAMAIKTAIRRGQKLVPKSVDQEWKRLERADDLDRRADDGMSTPMLGPIVDVDTVDDDGFPDAGGAGGDVDHAAGGGDQASGGGPAAPAVSPAASLPEKKALARAARAARVAEADVAGRYGKASFDELTAANAEEALAFLAKMAADEAKE